VTNEPGAERAAEAPKEAEGVTTPTATTEEWPNDGVAAPAVLRRVQLLAAAWGLVAAIALAVQGGPRRGLVLTLAAALSIVALRSLEGVVRRLRVPATNVPATRVPGQSVPGSSVPADSEPAETATPDSLGLGYVLRLFLLAALVMILALGGRDPLALILGLSAVPLALLGEALVQVVALRGGREP
jgi:hypothetical protein